MQTRHRAAADQGETGEGPDPTSMDLMARVANLCDTVAQRLVLADHGPQGQGPRPQVPVPLYTGYDDRKSVADFLAELAAYKLATGASDEYVLARVLPVAFQASAARWWRIGTTGQPKAARLSHFNVINNANIVGRFVGYHQKRESICLNTDLIYGLGRTMGVLAASMFGSTIVTAGAYFLPKVALEVITKHR
ncbi:hypothetical protein ISCGN_019253 [Ixodes scapularis]